ncbi:MAG: PQQ-binding-like beta-propeller repeat protein [Gemmataceae bacterium]|nr:PQQ-binding-like beta-propeller repeat protein [Gemmataceae bacterium]
MNQGLPFLLLALPVIVLRAEDVPQFRGPGGSGVSKEKGLPVEWTEKENIRWKAALPGRGLGNPVIAAGRVYVTACSGFEQKRLHVLCFDLKNGKQLWERQFWATGATQCHPKTNMAAPTPATDGARVYALYATGDLVCLDKEGNLVWYRSLAGDYPTIGNNVGMAASIILWNDLVLLAMENVGDSFAAGIDKDTGVNRWRVERQRGINWTTPLLIQNQGEPEVIFQSSDLTAYDPSSGKKKWTLSGGFAGIPSPTFGGGLVLAPGGKFQAVRPGTDKGKPEVVWQSNRLGTGFSSPAYHEGKVYALGTNGVLNCADAVTGKALWDVRLEGNYAASPLVADGKLYAVNEKGDTSVVQLGAAGTLLGVNSLEDTILATPVASDGAIFLRSDRLLYCIGAGKRP